MPAKKGKSKAETPHREKPPSHRPAGDGGVSPHGTAAAASARAGHTPGSVDSERAGGGAAGRPGEGATKKAGEQPHGRTPATGVSAAAGGGRRVEGSGGLASAAAGAMSRGQRYVEAGALCVLVFITEAAR